MSEELKKSIRYVVSCHCEHMKADPDCNPCGWREKALTDLDTICSELSAAKAVIEAADRIVDKHPDEWGDSPLADALKAYYALASLPPSPSDSTAKSVKKCGHGPDMLKVVDLYCAQCVEEAK